MIIIALASLALACSGSVQYLKCTAIFVLGAFFAILAEVIFLILKHYHKDFTIFSQKVFHMNDSNKLLGPAITAKFKEPFYYFRLNGSLIPSLASCLIPSLASC